MCIRDRAWRGRTRSPYRWAWIALASLLVLSLIGAGVYFAARPDTTRDAAARPAKPAPAKPAPAKPTRKRTPAP